MQPPAAPPKKPSRFLTASNVIKRLSAVGHSSSPPAAAPSAPRLPSRFNAAQSLSPAQGSPSVFAGGEDARAGSLGPEAAHSSEDLGSPSAKAVSPGTGLELGLGSNGGLASPPPAMVEIEVDLVRTLSNGEGGNGSAREFENLSLSPTPMPEPAASAELRPPVSPTAELAASSVETSTGAAGDDAAAAVVVVAVADDVSASQAPDQDKEQAPPSEEQPPSYEPQQPALLVDSPPVSLARFPSSSSSSSSSAAMSSKGPTSDAALPPPSHALRPAESVTAPPEPADHETAPMSPRQERQPSDNEEDAQSTMDEFEDEDNVEEETPHPPTAPAAAAPPPQIAASATHPLLLLTAAVAKELDVLPETTPVDEQQSQPWVYAPAHANVSPMLICVIDPDGLWPFLETPMLERMRHSQTGGAKRAVFVARETLRGGPATSTFARYRAPYLHLCLIRCETLAEYTSTTRPRLKAFVEDVERREDPEWLLVLVESSKHSRKVFDKIKLEFTPARCCSASVFDQARGGGGLDFFKTAPNDKRRRAGAGDGQWGELARRVGALLEKAQTTRFAKYTLREMDPNYCAHFVASENLIFALLQADKYVKALEMYDGLETAYRRLGAQGDALVEKMKRICMDPGQANRLSALHFCFPVSSNSNQPSSAAPGEDLDVVQHHQAFPARILDVARFPFRDLIATSAVSHLQLEGYLFSRRMLLLLAMGLPWLASKVAVKFVLDTQKQLRRAYDDSLDVVDAWVVAVCLELVAATHGCAAIFASTVSSSDRVALSACQAELLGLAITALDAIALRVGATLDDFSPLLVSVAHPRADWTDWPGGLARALAAPELFKMLYVKLLEAAAAHSVAAGRFRTAAAYTHRWGLVAKDDHLLLDAARWWSGEARPVVVDGKDPLVYDDWPSLRAVSALAVPKALLESVVPVYDLVSIRRRELFEAICSAFDRGEITSLPLAVKHSGTLDSSWIRVEFMSPPPGEAPWGFEVTNVKVTYVSLVEPGVSVEAEASAQGGWLRSSFEPANAYGYFVPEDAMCTVVFPGREGAGARKSARGFFMERSILHIPEPDVNASVALVVPPIIAVGCDPQEVLVVIEGTLAPVEISVSHGSGLVLVDKAGALSASTMQVEGVGKVWLRASNDFFGTTHLAVELKDKLVSASVSVETAFESRARALVRLDGSVVVAIHFVSLIQGMALDQVIVTDPHGEELPCPSPVSPLPIVLGKGEGVWVVYLLETTAPERAGMRSLIPCAATASFRLSDFAYRHKWDLPILIRRSRLGDDVAPPVNKATIGYVWGDEDDEQEANEHPSLMLAADGSDD